MASPDPGLHPDETELLIRRVSDQVTSSVRGSLFKFYAAVGSVAVAVAALAGLNFWNTAMDNAENRAASVITDRVEPKIKAAEEKLEEAEQKLDDMEVQKQVAQALQKRATTSLDNLDSLFTSARPKIEMLEKMQARIDEVERRIAASTESIAAAEAELRQKLDEIDNQIATARVRTTDLTTALARAEAAIGALSAIPEAVKKLATLANDDSVVKTANGAQIQADTAETKPVVFFQYYAMPRATADAVSTILRSEGFVLPQSESVVMSQAGERSVRFYHEADGGPATRLAQTVDRILASLGQAGDPVRIISLTEWPKAKPKQGTIELWIGLPAKPETE